MRTLSIALLVLGMVACRDVDRATRGNPSERPLIAIAAAIRESSPDEVAWSAHELGRIAARVKVAIESADGAGREVAAIAVLNEVVFGELGFVREVDDTNLRFVLLPTVLRNRAGSCVGLGTLYLALGEILHLPLEGVVRPGHFYVRSREGEKSRNVELLRKGEDMPDDWYRVRFPIPAGSGREYARRLSMTEVLGVVEYDVGNERRREGRLAEARSAFEQSTRDFPELSEAHASLGAVQQLLGNLDQAEGSYRAAQRANPALSGLDRNVSLVESERAARANAIR
jgi:tetratricopeptide (TPR) repeat protein